MRRQTIIWTALPQSSTGANGAGTTLRLSAFVSPRLWDSDASVTKAKLGDYGTDFLDWPLTVATAKFEVKFEGGPTLQATPTRVAPLRSDLWKKLFNTETLVIPFRFRDLSDATFLTINTVKLEGILKQAVQSAGTIGDGTELPSRDDDLAKLPIIKNIGLAFTPPQPPELPKDGPTVVVGKPKPPVVIEPTPGGEPPAPKPGCCLFGCLALPFVLLRRLLKHLGLIALLPFTMGGFGGRRGQMGPERYSDDGGAVPTPDPPNPDRDACNELKEFIEPTSPTSEEMPTAKALKEDVYDFHQMVSSLGDYPLLLRDLGLVIDLEVELTAAVPDPGAVRVDPTTIVMNLSDTKHYSPRTHYELGASTFSARSHPTNGEIRNGLLRVDEPARFRVVQVDVAGGITKLQNAATALLQKRAPNEPEKQGIPTLQTAGLSLVRPGFASQLQALLEIALLLNKGVKAHEDSVPPPPEAIDELWAEDVLRGYRVDVFDDQKNRWHSLCQRVGTYDFNGVPEGPLDDEGFIETAATEPVKKPDPPVLRVHESLFTWSGWSLAAPRYGLTILPDFDPGDKTRTGPPPNDPATQFKLKVSFTPKPKSLPRLRFGYSYQLRVRTVDLAGNSAFGPDDDLEFQKPRTEVTPLVRYRRFEPVAPPMVMLQANPVEGESLERLVIRSRFDDLPAVIDAQQTNRHIIPPKTSQLMAEQHRKFDGPVTMMRDAIGYERAARESGATTHTLDPVTEDRILLPGVPEPTLHEVWLQTYDTFDIPYLPDPYARGVLFMGLPGLGANDVIDLMNKIRYDTTWPDHKPLLLRVKGIHALQARQKPQWNAGPPRVLTVEVKQGETFEVRVSSYFDPKDRDNLAIWDWLKETGAPNLAVLQDRADEGRNWLHSPFRTLVLVHATMQPLIVPQLNALTTNKSLGGTKATVTGTCTIDAKSTEKFDVHASWTDDVDDLSQPGPGVSEQTMHVAQVKATDPADDNPTVGIEHVVGDTKYHDVTYTAIASTRFREYFPNTTPREQMVRPVPPPLPGAEMPLTANAKIRNSARPAGLKLQYIVPTFGWKRTSAPASFTSKRTGGGLRVYLDRPWYSSGSGELVGIVLRPPAVAPNSPQAEALSKYTSEWGMDPLWPATATKPLTTFDFLAPSQTGLNVLLAEINERVDVVGYRPEYDTERRLWYCDILLEPQNAYFPMVRLALVRFHPESVDEAHISTVAPADFIQVVPHREVKGTVTDAPGETIFDVTVNGPAYFTMQLEDKGAPQMILRIERPAGLGSGDELDWEPVSVTRMNVAPNALNTVWTAEKVRVPHPRPLRVVVLEVERYRTYTDRQRFTDDPLQVLQGANLDTFGHPLFLPDDPNEETQLGYRVTFAEGVEV